MSDESPDRNNSDSEISSGNYERKSKPRYRDVPSRTERRDSSRARSSRSRRSKKGSGYASESSDDGYGQAKARNRRPRAERRDSLVVRYASGRRSQQLLDFRESPKLEGFREETGQDLMRYLRKFEDYCHQNFRGSKDF